MTLSPYMYVGESKYATIILSLYLTPWAVSSEALIAMNPEPDTEFLTLDCFFEYHLIGASCKMMKNPVEQVQSYVIHHCPLADNFLGITPCTV